LVSFTEKNLATLASDSKQVKGFPFPPKILSQASLGHIFQLDGEKSVLHKINLQHEKGEEKKVRDNRGQFDEPMFDQ
jgi:hypothetical protein